MKLHRFLFACSIFCVAKIVLGHESFETKFYLALAAFSLFIVAGIAHLAQDEQGRVVVAGLLAWKLVPLIPLILFLGYMFLTH